jgi:pyridoxine/pyridoxamine 5'-phosphate oxidase
MPDEGKKISPEELEQWQDIEKRLVEKGTVSQEEREFYFARLKVAQGALLNQKLT